jgi:hypothetical protein
MCYLLVLRHLEELGDASGDSSSPIDDDEVETPNLTQTIQFTQPTQEKGKKRALTLSIRGKGKKGGASSMLIH